MKICGLQKLTLIDYPSKVACTLFLYGCNFRCGFCHNPELVIEPPQREYNKEEIIKFLTKRKKYLDGVCITGGEPLMSVKTEFIKKLKGLGYLIKIDTNGSYPEKLIELISSGLIDYVAMDIKSSKDSYEKLTGKCDINKIEQSIKIIAQLPNYEFRTTILKNYHNEEEIKKMFEWINELTNGKIKKFVLQGFKKENKLLDENFNEKNTTEQDLEPLKKIAEQYAQKVILRI